MKLKSLLMTVAVLLSLYSFSQNPGKWGASSGGCIGDKAVIYSIEDAEPLDFCTADEAFQYFYVYTATFENGQPVWNQLTTKSWISPNTDQFLEFTIKHDSIAISRCLVCTRPGGNWADFHYLDVIHRVSCKVECPPETEEVYCGADSLQIVLDLTRDSLWESRFDLEDCRDVVVTLEEEIISITDSCGQVIRFEEGTPDNLLECDVRLSPNPAHQGRTFLEVGLLQFNCKDVEIKVYDVDTKEVYENLSINVCPFGATWIENLPLNKKLIVTLIVMDNGIPYEKNLKLIS